MNSIRQLIEAETPKTWLKTWLSANERPSDTELASAMQAAGYKIRNHLPPTPTNGGHFSFSKEFPNGQHGQPYIVGNVTYYTKAEAKRPVCVLSTYVRPGTGNGVSNVIALPKLGDFLVYLDRVETLLTTLPNKQAFSEIDALLQPLLIHR